MTNPSQPPNPANSPIEKLLLQRQKLWTPDAMSRYLQQEGLDATLAAPLGRAFARLGEESNFQFQQAVAELQTWANVHTHPGVSTGAGGGEPAATDVFSLGGVTASGLRTENQGYDPVTNTWAAFAPLPAARYYAGGGAVGNKAYVLGGSDGSAARDTVYAYDPTTDTWDTSRTPCPVTFSSVGSCVLDGAIYVAGGNLLSGVGFYRYTPSTDTWERLTDLPVARWFPTLLGTGGFVYIFGGDADATIDSGTDTHYAYEVATGAITTLSPMSTVNGSATAAAAAQMLGGVGYYGGGISSSGSRASSFRSYDPATNTFGASLLASLPAAMYHHRFAALGDRLHLAGGYTGAASNGHHAYSPGPDTWTASGASGATDGSTASMSVATYGHVLVGLAPNP